MNAVDITARGLAVRALESDAAQAMPSGASTIGTADGGTVQKSLDKLPGRSLVDATATDLDATGDVEQVNISGRGMYRKTATLPSAIDISRGFGFTDAGGKNWAKPADRICRASEYGIVAHDAFDEWGDAVGTPIDMAPQLQDLCARVKSLGGGKVVFEGLRGAIALGSSVVVPYGVSLDGVSAAYASAPFGFLDSLSFIPTVDGQYYDSTGIARSVANDGDCQQGIMFWANIDPTTDPNNWVQQYPNVGAGQFLNLNIYGGPTGGIKGIRFAGSYQFRNIRCWSVSTLIEKPNLYTDGVVIEDIYAEERANNTDFLIDLIGLGDGYLVRGISPGYTGEQVGITYGIRVGLARGGRIEGVINGIDLIVGATAIEYVGVHKEGGQIIVDDADVAIRSGHFHNGNGNLTPIVLRNSQEANSSSCRVSVDDCCFVHHVNPSGGGGQGWSATEIMDIDVQSDRIQLVMNGGNRRISSISGQVDRRQQHAPLIGDSTGGGVFENWRNYAPLLATQPTTIFSRKVSVTGRMPSHSANWDGITASSFTPLPYVDGVAYKGPDGDNRYVARPLYDPERLLGRTPSANDQVTVTATNGSSTLPAFTVDMGSSATAGGVMWEVYRDTLNDGSFDKRVLVPGIDLKLFIDDGEVLNGFAWSDNASGAITPLNNNGFTGAFDYIDGVLTIVSSAANIPPSVGNWNQGDTIALPWTAPDASAMKLASRTCRTGGTPGVWDPQYFSTMSPAA